MSTFFKDKVTAWYIFAVSAVFALISLILYVARGGDIFTTVSPIAVALNVAGIVLTCLMLVKDVKPLEIIPFVLYLAALLIFFGSEIEFIGNVAYGTDGQAISASFIGIAVFGLLSVIGGMFAAISGIEKE